MKWKRFWCQNSWISETLAWKNMKRFRNTVKTNEKLHGSSTKSLPNIINSWSNSRSGFSKNWQEVVLNIRPEGDSRTKSYSAIRTPRSENEDSLKSKSSTALLDKEISERISRKSQKYFLKAQRKFRNVSITFSPRNQGQVRTDTGDNMNWSCVLMGECVYYEKCLGVFHNSTNNKTGVIFVKIQQDKFTMF